MGMCIFNGLKDFASIDVWGVLGHLICSFVVQGFLNPRFLLVEGILGFRFMGPRLFGFWVYDF